MCICHALREKGGILTSEAIGVRCNGYSRIVSHGACLDLLDKITPIYLTIPNISGSLAKTHSKKIWVVVLFFISFFLHDAAHDIRFI